MSARVILTINGLAEFKRDLKAIDRDLPKALRLALNESADLVVEAARPHMPVMSGRAARSIKARSTQNEARVQEGGAGVPYVPWLDFGGKRTGKGGGVAVRAFYSDGRVLYHGFYEVRDDGRFEEQLAKSLLSVAAQAGVQVEGGA